MEGELPCSCDGVLVHASPVFSFHQPSCSDRRFSEMPSVVIKIYEFNKTSLRVCVSGGGGPLRAILSLTIAAQALCLQARPSSVAVSSSGCGCECFRGLLVSPMSLTKRASSLLPANFLISSSP